MFRVVQSALLTLLLMLCLSSAVADEKTPPDPGSKLWEPTLDTPYLQEEGWLLPTQAAIDTVAVHEGRLYAGDASGVLRLEGTELRRMNSPSKTHRLMAVYPTLYAAADNGLWTLSNGQWQQRSTHPALDVCEHNGLLALVSTKGLFRLEGDQLVTLTEKEGPALLGVESYGGTLYVHDGKRLGLLDRGEIVWEDIADWGKQEPGSAIRDMLAVGSRLYLATDEGLGLLRGMSWYWIKGENGLCYEDTTSLTRGFEQDLWIGTKRGAIRNIDSEYQFFGHARWLPHDEVTSIASSGDTVYIATKGGLGIIHYEPYTLAKKAAYYERWLEEWGMKRLGFVHSLNLIDGEWLREVSDNDVGFSSHYLTAKCFEYAVTGSKEARATAVEMMKTVKWSEEITPMDGFPARSIYAAGEPTLKAMHGSGGLPAEWHPTPDGVWEWKGDTSSDEVDAHVWAASIFLKLVANEEEKKWATEHLHRLVGHIVDNGFFLRDVDGKPTRWARWDPEYLQTPYGYYARGLNGMEAFNYVTTALHFTGDEKFSTAKEQLLAGNYLNDILRQKLTFHPGFFTHFDDRLAFYSYYSLIQHETDPELKSIWRRSLERSWEVKRIEGLPWFNFIYGAVTGNDFESDRAAQHLREWPLDLRKYSYTNSHRDDLHTPEDYRTYSERTRAFSPREIEPGRWDNDFMKLDNSNGGAVVADPTGWLDAYWMGRYYGFISAPQTKDKALISVQKRGLQMGAKPYAGPARPKLKHEQ